MSDARWRLVCFDLDGTLVYRTTTSQHLAERLGHADTLLKLEQRYAAGEISNKEVADDSAFHFRGYHFAEIDALMKNVALIQGIDPTLRQLRGHHIEVILATVTWRFAARSIAQRFAIDKYSGTEMAEDARGKFEGSVSHYFDEFDKRDFVAAYCAECRIPAAQVIAVGDSRSDIPLFGWAGFSIALNGTAAAKAAATIALDTDDLRDIIEVIPGLS